MTDLNRTPDRDYDKTDRTRDKAFGKHDDNPGVADHIGEAAGGVSGVVTGAAIGSAIGPVGTLLGGILGAMGGWWAGRSLAEAATSITPGDDTYYRRHFESTPGRFGSKAYDDAKPAYYFGHLASRNPDYRDRPFEEIETDLRRGWTTDRNRGTWDDVRSFASEGFGRGRSTLGNVAGGVADRADDLKDRVDGNPASRPGPDRTDRSERQF